jgi:hypothetical protein
MTIADLAALQRPDGGFASVVASARGRVEDCNGFSAAIVLRLTRHLPHDSTLALIRARALAYISTCSSADVPDAFAFWPDHTRPAWAASVPADVDDTAIMLTELVRHGSVDREDALRRFCRVIEPQRVDRRDVHRLPPWIVPDCFYTWIGAATTRDHRRLHANVVDACVNVNVIALMAFLGATDVSGYRQAVACVQNAVHWADANAARLSAITPFYPSVVNLVDALEHAVECGADPLAEVLHQLRALGVEISAGQPGCCRSAYGSTVWHCEAVEVARALARGAHGHSIDVLQPAYAV